ncbi:MAG TPA: protein kinase [Pyrinomonadaceae bacterium]|jgi:Tol biopolymer transport system component/tRNA A-37 threonylcarbamoyl transferase component Bud32
MSIAPGITLGRYEIQSLLGAGGMGEVYRARDTELNRPVALKFLHAEVAADGRRMQRFIQEARAASALNHPNILTVYDIGQTEDGTRFFATELVEGATLRERMPQRLKLGEVLDIVIQTASALVAAHQAGIVHRDIKPENIMLRRDGYVKVLDFGLAKLTGQPSTSVDTEAATQALVQTDPGAVMGTVAYMSPEQARGEEVDARTDIWSLGVVLYELLTGQLPFKGRSPSHTVVALLDDEPPPLARFLADAPEALQEIVTDALTKDREARYQTAKQMLAKLQRLKGRLDAGAHLDQSVVPDAPGQSAASTSGAGTAGSASAAPPTVSADAPAETLPTAASVEQVVNQIMRRRTAKTLAVVAAVLAVSAAGVGLVKLFTRPDSRGANVSSAFAAMKIERLTDTGKAGSVAISPDGKLVVHVVEDAGQQSLWLRHVATGSNVQIIAPAEVRYGRMTFSPDGDYVYFTRRPPGAPAAPVYAVPVFGGEAKKVVEDALSSVTFAPDGRQLAFVRWHSVKDESYLVTANLDGTNERTLATLKTHGLFKPNGPAWSPDGRVIAVAVTQMEGDGAPYEYPAVVGVADGSITPVGARQWADVGRVGWLADGSALVAACEEKGARVDQYYLISYPDGAARRVTNDLNDYHDLSLTADASTLATVQEDRVLNIWVAPGADARSLRQLTSGSFKYEGQWGLRWLPDGRILYESAVNAVSGVWVMNADGTGQKLLTGGFGSASNLQPVGSPDGRYVVFVSDRAGKQHLWRTDADGAHATQLTAGDAYEYSPAFTPDGRWVLYARYDGEHYDVFKVATEGGTPVRLTEGFLADYPLASPDGRWLAAVYRERGGAPPKYALFAPDGGPPVKLLDAPQASADLPIRWLPDSRALAYIETRKGVSNIWALPLDGGRPRPLTDFTSGQISNFDLARDGRPTLFSRGETRRDVVLITGFK